MAPKTFRGYEIHIGEKPLVDIAECLRKGGVLTSAMVERGEDGARSTEEEERERGRQPIAVSTVFEDPRAPFIEALRAIIGYIFERYQLPQGGGVDFGSGATGAMVEQLMAPFINSSNWAQVEINPASVRENRRRHPTSAILEGSYHDIKALGLEGRLRIVTALSALDNTEFLSHAVAEITSALQPGGYLLHVQDVRPGVAIQLQEMERYGMKAPFEVGVLPKNDDPLIYKTAKGWVNVGELLRTALGNAIQCEPKLEPVLNHWITARRRLHAGRGWGRNYFLNMHSIISESVEEASAIVTLARRKA